MDNNTWQLSASRLLNGSLKSNGKQGIDTSDVITKDNWSIMSYNYAHVFGDDYLVIFNAATPMQQTGLKYSERYIKESEYYKKNPAILGIFIFMYHE
jgi:hypothetical protein